MDYASLVEFVKARRTRRAFKPDAIPADAIAKIIEVARWAPSGFNLQPWEFVVVQQPALKEQIVHLVDAYRASDFVAFEAAREPDTGAPWQPDPLGPQREFALDNAPAFILLFGDTRTQRGLPMDVRWNYLAPIWHATMANAFLYMLLAAHALELACCWVSVVQMPVLHCKLKQLLGIPDVYALHELIVRFGHKHDKIKK